MEEKLLLKVIRESKTLVLVEHIKDYIQDDKDTKARDTAGMTCLHLLCSKNHVSFETLKYLVERGANPKDLTSGTYIMSLDETIPRDCLYYYCVIRPTIPRIFNIPHHGIATVMEAGIPNLDISTEILKYLIQHGADPMSLICASQKIFKKNDLQLSLILLSLDEFPNSFSEVVTNYIEYNKRFMDHKYHTYFNCGDTSSFQHGTPLYKLEKRLRTVVDDRSNIWIRFYENLFGMLSNNNKIAFLVDNCKYFTKSTQEKIKTVLLLDRCTNLFFKLKMPKNLWKVIMALSLNVEILPLLILVMPDNLLNLAIENTLQEYDMQYNLKN